MEHKLLPFRFTLINLANKSYANILNETWSRCLVVIVFKFKKVFNYNERLDQLPEHRAFEVAIEVKWRLM